MWGDLLFTVGQSVNKTRRTQIVAELMGAFGYGKGNKREINSLIEKFSNSDSDITKRAMDESYWKENIISMESQLIQDSLPKIFD